MTTKTSTDETAKKILAQDFYYDDTDLDWNRLHDMATLWLMKREVEQAVDDSRRALDDWLHVHAPQECHEAHVVETYNRIADACGTIAYIGDLNQVNRDLLTKLKEIEDGTD